jgi:hypothetical protein
VSSDGFYNKEFLSQLSGVVTVQGTRVYILSVIRTLIPDFIFTCRLCSILKITENVPVINLFVFDRT